MLGLAVIAQPFAVIGGQDDDRIVVDPEAAQLFEQPSDHLVDGGDLAIVG